MAEHEHVWKLNLHLDGCHFYQSGYSCECGATRVTSDERDLSEDPYSAVWMEGDGEDKCPRCAELRAGAKPKHADEIVLPA